MCIIDELDLSYKEFLIGVAENAINTNLLLDDTRVLGHNGPYYDPQTRVRNVSHWSIILGGIYIVTQKNEYLKVAVDLLDEIISYSGNYTYTHRQKLGKDIQNGVIGTAWNIEAFALGYHYSKNIRFLHEAIRLTKLFPFDSSKGIWKSCAPNGAIGGYDATFNHQLWYAASIAMVWAITKDDSLEDQLNCFFNKLPHIMNIHSSGLICHPISYSLLQTWYRVLLKKSKYLLNKLLNGESFHYKELGYHCFVVYAFAIIKSTGYRHSFFDSVSLAKILDFTFSAQFLDEVKEKNNKSDVTHLPLKDIEVVGNRYGYAYNPVGFELQFINKVFCLNKEAIAFSEFKFEIEHFFDREKYYAVNSEDNATLTARVYELARVYLL